MCCQYGGLVVTTESAERANLLPTRQSGACDHGHLEHERERDENSPGFTGLNRLAGVYWSGRTLGCLPCRRLGEGGTCDLRLPSPASLNQSQRAHGRLVHGTGRIQSVVLLVTG
jgi:hypothetical protein